MGRLWMVFSGRGGGGEEKAPGHISRFGFRWTTRAIKQPHFFVIYYILSSGNFAATCFRLPRIEDSEGAAAPRSVTDSTDQWVWCLMHMRSMLYDISVIYLV